MSQSDYYRRALASLKDKEASLRRDLNRYQGEQNRALEDVRKQEQSALRTTSASSRNSYLGAAERARRKAADVGRRIADITQKLAQNAREQASKVSSLHSAEKSEQQAATRDDDRRRRREIDHAQQLRRLADVPQIRFVHIREPEPEKLRVLYLTANPGADLMTETEVRQVQQALRGARHRERIEIALRPAATFQDLLDGLNDVRPHIVHFSGHSGDEAIQLDNGDIARNEGHDVDFMLLVKALAATDTPPELLVLNSCDSLSGAEMLLPAIPVVIGMSDAIPDTAAIVFAQQFYAAIGSGQSVGSALKQGQVAVEAIALGDGVAELPQFIAREGVAIESLVLVKPLG